MFLCVDLDAGRTERQQALLVFAKIDDVLFGVECAFLGLVDGL